MLSKRAEVVNVTGQDRPIRLGQRDDQGIDCRTFPGFPAQLSSASGYPLGDLLNYVTCL
jgi:hypothetical protein